MATRNVLEQEHAAKEIALRVERMRLPGHLAKASREVDLLRGDGRRQGDPELEEATQHLRELAARERELPHLICTEAAKRCQRDAASLHRDAAFLRTERDKLGVDYQRALNEAQEARNVAEDLRVRLESIGIRMDALADRARPLEDFATKANTLEGERRLKLLDDAHREGLLLDMPEVVPS